MALLCKHRGVWLVALFQIIAGGLPLFLTMSIPLKASPITAWPGNAYYLFSFGVINLLYVAAGIGLLLQKRRAWYASVALPIYTVVERGILVAAAFDDTHFVVEAAVLLAPSFIFAAICLLMLFRNDVLTLFAVTPIPRTTPATDSAGQPARKRHVYTVVICLVLLVGLTTAGIIIHSVFMTLDRLKINAARGDIGAYNSALALYHDDVNSHRYPAALQQLCSDNAAGWAGPYMATVTNDPWDNAYQYHATGGSYSICSVHHTLGAGQGITVRYTLGDTEIAILP
ncbi:MAG TPA: type II secretion system protein GspG [bacterium]|nr:type II secretion system protein GspG [bacterium]